MLDANVNRSNEALRVMEDAARFGLEDAEDAGALCGSLKNLRHQFRAIIDALPIPPGVLIANRDTPGDAGTSHTSPAERSRDGMLNFVIAAGKLLGVWLRVVE